ncbi:MAG: CARDB domain-containing protein [Patescibacteria group bacterium]
MKLYSKNVSRFSQIFIVSLFFVSLFGFGAQKAHAIYEDLQEYDPAAADLTPSVSGNTVNLSGWVRGSIYSTTSSCQDPQGAIIGSATGYIPVTASYSGGATTGSLTQTAAGDGGYPTMMCTPPTSSTNPSPYTYSFSGTIDVTGYAPGTYTKTITFTNPGIPCCGNAVYAPTYPINVDVTFTLGTTVTVDQGTCPNSTTWTSSNGYSGTGTGSFSFVPAGGGTNVSMSAVPPSGWVYTGSTPVSQLIFAGGSYTFTLDCTALVSQPDLTSTNMNAAGPMSSGQPTTFTAQVANIGAGNAGGSYTALQLAMGANGSGGGGTLWDVSTSPISASNSTSVSSPGTYTIFTSSSITISVRACADSGSALNESNEANNCGAWQNINVSGDSSYTGPVCGYAGNNAGSCGSNAPVPSLTVTAAPTSIASGNSSTVSWSTANMSSCSANWWSAAGTSGSVSVSPVTTTTYSKTCTDSVGNSYTGSATVTVTPAQTINLTAGSVSPTTVVYNATNSFSSTITNNGNTSTGSSFFNFFQIATGANGTGTVTGLSPASMGALSGNNSTSVASSPSGPYAAFTAPGTYYVRACADKSNAASAGSINETDESDNCGPWTTVSATASAGSFNYSLSNSGTSSITKGGANTFGTNTITKTLTLGSTQAVDLSVSFTSGQPSGVSYTISNPLCSPTCTSTITFTVTPATSAGTYPITVTGSPLGKTTSFNLVIVASPAIVVTCSANTPVALVGNTVTWNSTVSGGNGNYTYSWAGPGISTSPAPSTSSFGMVYTTVGLKTAVLTVTDSIGNTGSCSPAGSVQINFNPQFREI